MSKILKYRGPVIALSENIDGDIIEIQVLRTGNFFDPRYGKFSITGKLLSEMIDNFKKGTIKKEVSLDYVHDGPNTAAAWFKDLYTKDVDGSVGLFAKVELTGSGKKSLSAKDFKYVSADFDPKWKDNEKGEFHGCVLEGAGLTNRPVIRGMQAIQLSEDDGQDSELPEMSYAELLAKFSELEGRYNVLLEKEKGSIEDPNKLNKTLEGDTMNDVEKKLMEDKDAEILALKKGQSDLEEKVQLSEKNSKFDKMLSAGTVCEAQRKAFIANDMSTFAELQTKVKLSEHGTGTGHGGEGEESEDVEDKIAEEASKMVDSQKIKLSEAIKIVSAQPKFAEALAKKFE